MAPTPAASPTPVPSATPTPSARPRVRRRSPSRPAPAAPDAGQTEGGAGDEAEDDRHGGEIVLGAAGDSLAASRCLRGRASARRRTQRQHHRSGYRAGCNPMEGDRMIDLRVAQQPCNVGPGSTPPCASCAPGWRNGGTSSSRSGFRSGGQRVTIYACCSASACGRPAGAVAGRR